MNKKIYTLQMLLLVMICFISTTPIYSQTQADTDTITSRFRIYVLTNGAKPDTTVRAYLDSLQGDGSWNDINYSDVSITNWAPLTHLDRLLAICQSYNTTKSVYYHNDTVKTQIYSIFNFWNNAQPYSNNWYDNDIGGPIVYGESLILMKTGDSFGFSTDTLSTLAEIGLNYYNVSAAIYVPIANEAVMGSNQTYNLEISMYKACILDSTAELQRDFDTAFASVKVFAGANEGMKIDNSFFMHGAQLYNWGYGSEFLQGSAFMAYFARNTAYGTTQANINFLIDFVLDGQQWFGQKGISDFNSTGRGLTRSGGTSVSGFRTSCLSYLVSLSNNHRTTELNNFVKFLAGGNTNFQSPGNKQFWKADFMAQHGSTFYLSVKTPSKRTVGSESINGENLKGKYLPWGSTNIMITGKEYATAFPVWDWNRVPGTTTESNPSANFSKMPSGGYTPTNSFAGGVSNGVYGLSADAFSFDSVNARKAYFFTPSAMYCLGAGITSTKSEGPILTSVNQCVSSGTVTVDSAGIQSAFTGKQEAYTKLNWVHHNNVGYLFPHQGNITVANQVQTGSWYSINTSQSSTPVSATIFSAWFNHGTKPSTGTYEYIVAPYKSVSQFASWATTNQLKKVTNNANAQAFADDSAGVYGIAFYKVDSLLLDTASSFSIKTNNPALLLIQKQTNGYTISVADPTQLLTSITLTTSQSLSGPNATINVDSTTTINFILPKGDSAGATVTSSYTLVSTVPIHFEEIKASLTDNKASINWNVANEVGIQKYDIEKSVDGIIFNSIGEQTAHNASTDAYIFIDNNPSTINYYRIKAISEAGVAIYSSVVKLSTHSSPLTAFNLYPNPLINKILNLQLTNVAAGKYDVSIYNVLGQKVNEQSITHSGGTGSYGLTINNNLTSGTYLVSIRDAASEALVYQGKLMVR